MATLEDLRSRALLILGADPDEESDYSDQFIIDAAGAALDAILTRVWKPASDTIAASATTHALPSDFVEVQGVWDTSQGMFLDPAIMAPGEPQANISGNGWFLFPSGYISFYSALGADGATLHYAAQWAKPLLSADIIAAPDYALTPVALYMASYLLLQKATSASELGAYRTRIDSGGPEDNPLMQMSSYLLNRFDIEMNRMPTISKGVQ